MILTKAIAGIARSGATRAGWPVLLGFKVPLYALSNVARSGATRANYIDTTRAYISVGWWDYASLILADKPSHYWRLNETTGATAVDLVGGANGTITGGVTLAQPGAIIDGDLAMTFNGTTGKIDVPVRVPVLCTIEAWIKTTDTTQRCAFGSADWPSTGIYAGVGGGGALFVYCGTVGAAPGVRVVANGAWRHVAYVLNGSTATLYVDGVLDAVVTFVRAAAGNAVANIGFAASAQYWNGGLDDVAIYPYALTAAQIKAHYTTGITGKYPLYRADGILVDSLAIDDSLSSTPTTGTFTAYGWVPVEGSDVVVTLGSPNNLRREFGGTILKTRHRYAGDYPIARNMLYDSALIDYAWGLQRKKVSGRFKATTVGAIAVSLMTSAPVGYTLRIEDDIAASAIDEITFTETNLDDAIGQLAKRVGGDWQCDYLKVVRVFFVDTVSTPPSILNTVHRSMAGITWDRDLSQVVTRVYVDAGGSDALEAIAPGDTLIPVATAAWYETTGGVVLAGPQRVKYAGVVAGGGGSLVGPGASPTGTPNVTLQPGAGVDVGTHEYAVTFTTPSGETLPGPRVTVPVGLFLAPPTAPTPGTAGPGATGPDPGVHDYAVSFVITGGETVPGPRVVGSTGITPPPDTGPTANPGTVGVGPDPGVHDYAVSFVTASGQTPAGPIGSSITIANTPIPAPTVGPTTNPATSGGNVDVGDHWYSLTFVTANGETTVGPVTQGTALPQSPVADPSAYPGTARGTGQNNITGGWLYYSYAYRTASGETLQSPTAEVLATLVPGPPFNTYYNVAVTAPASPDPAVSSIVFYRSFSNTSQKRQWATSANVNTTYTDDCSNTTGPLSPTGGNTTISAGPKRTIPLTAIPTGPIGTTARKIYRTPVGGGIQKFLATLNNNSSTTYTDTTADSALGGGSPGSNTALVLTAVHLTGIPRGTGASSDAVTGRNVYRRSGGAGLRWVALINDNSATTYDDTAPNASLGVPPFDVNTATLRRIPLSKLPLGNALVLSRKVYRTIANAGGGQLKLVATVADNVTTDFLDTVNDAALGAAALTVGTAQAAQAQLTAIPLGAASVTARKVYRTKAGLAQLQLLTTIADNLTTAWLDIAADATLGANAPASDTSTLKQPEGNVLAGSASLPCASVAAFRTAGGWAIVASQILRYTGISGNAITGIPATGPGAITATITFNTTAVAAPLLTGIPATGVGAIRVAIVKGDAVDLFIQEDDVAAQTALAAQLGGGADGIVEDEIQDRRLSATEARARARARLALLAERDADGKVGLITVHYTCRDINTRAGATVTINLGPPINLRGDFLIQRVTINQFGNPHVPPTYTVEASSARFTFEELLRVIREAAA